MFNIKGGGFTVYHANNHARSLSALRSGALSLLALPIPIPLPLPPLPLAALALALAALTALSLALAALALPLALALALVVALRNNVLRIPAGHRSAGVVVGCGRTLAATAQSACATLWGVRQSAVAFGVRSYGDGWVGGQLSTNIVHDAVATAGLEGFARSRHLTQIV